MVEGSKQLRKAFPQVIPLEVDIFRGDSWQLLVKDPRYALRVALFYRAFLRARMESHDFNTRIGVAIGELDFVPRDSVSEGQGEVYTLSGKALENLPNTVSMSFLSSNNLHKKCLNTIVQLIDSLSTRWTDKQSLAILGALQGWTQKKIAKILWEKKISQQAVAQHLKSSGWYAVEKGIEYFEEYIQAK